MAFFSYTKKFKIQVSKTLIPIWDLELKYRALLSSKLHYTHFLVPKCMMLKPGHRQPTEGSTASFLNPTTDWQEC